jgi:hypothetical protein
MPKSITVSITAEEEKALLTDIVSLQEWLDNAIHNKARQCIDEVCRQALEDESNSILTVMERQEIVSALAAQGRIISTVKQLPADIKAQIVACARVKTTAQRQADLEK